MNISTTTTKRLSRFATVDNVAAADLPSFKNLVSLNSAPASITQNCYETAIFPVGSEESEQNSGQGVRSFGLGFLNSAPASKSPQTPEGGFCLRKFSFFAPASNIQKNPYIIPPSGVRGLFILLLTLSLLTLSPLTHAQRTFAPAVDYATGTQPISVAIGDFNGDGFPDMAVANQNSNTIGVYTNTGNGSFGIRVDYATGSGPISVAIGDLDGDGRPDLAVANFISNTVSVFTNTGNGNLGIKIDYATGLRPRSVAIGDLNGDGRLDLVIANNNSSTVSVLTNTGNGSFGVKIDYLTGNRPSSVAIGNLNNDSFLDLAVTNSSSNTVSVFTNTGSGSFGAKVDYACGTNPTSIVIGDLNNDGYLDLCLTSGISSQINLVSVLTNTGSGIFNDKIDYITDYDQGNVGIGDINGDNKLDLIVAATPTNNAVASTAVVGLINDGFGILVVNKLPYLNIGPINVFIADLNNDNKSDLITLNQGSNTLSVLLAKDAQQIGLGNTTSYGSVFTITATSGLAVTATSSNASILNIAGNAATATGVGVVTVTAFQNGNGSFFGVTTTGVLTITQANLTVQGNNFTRAYGAANPSFTSSVTGLVLGNTVNVSYSTTATASSNVGNYPITATVTGANINNYALTINNSQLTIIKANQTITSAINSSYVSVYNGSVTAFNPNITVSSGLPYTVFNENPAVGMFNNTGASSNGIPSMQFGYGLVAGTTTSYIIQIGNGNFNGVTISSSIVVNKANATITAFNATKTYGDANPIFTGSIAGIVGGDMISGLYGSVATQTSNVGNYPITATATGANVNNYQLLMVNGQLNIAKANATVQGDNFTKVYGMANPMFTGTVLGVFNNDIITPGFSTTATSLSGVGVYQIMATATGSNITNYALIINNSVLTIIQANLTVQGNNFSRVYGSVNPIFTGTVLGVVNNDNISPSFSTTATSLSGVGVYQITATATGSNINNYALIINNSVLTITSLAFVSTAASPIVFNSTVFDGSPKIPSVLGLPSTSGVNYTYNGSPTAPTNTGSYTVVGIITDQNYTGTVTSVIVISPSNLSNQISVAGLSNSVYDSSPKPTSITGLPSGVASTITYNGSPTAPTNAGSYTVVGIVNDANYVGTTTSVMVIMPAMATITAFNATRTYGAANPVFTGSIAGIINGDMISGLYSSVATQTSNVGNYVISATASGANIGNYTFSIINSQLSITAAISTVTVSGASANGSLPTATSITISGTGFEPGATVTINGVAISNFTVSGTAIIATMPAGTLNATSNVILVQNPNQLASANSPVVITDINLSLIVNNLSLTINHLPLTIHPNPTSGAFTVSNTELGTTLYIFNAQGALVYSQKIIEESTSVNAHLSSGIYLVKVGNNSKKLIVSF